MDMAAMAMAMELPIGYRFNPTDEELITHYLLNKHIGKPLPMEGAVKECDLYNEKQLLEIFSAVEEPETMEKTKLYFFMQLKKKTEKGLRINRTVGKGTWKAQDKGKPIMNDEGRLIGSKRTLHYENKQSKQHGQWNMKEYSLAGDFLEHERLNNYVLCQLKMNYRGIKHKRRHDMQLKHCLESTLSNEIHEDEDLVMINGPTSQVINYGYLNNNPIRSHQPHHLPTQNFRNSSIAGAATASLSGEFEMPMPSSTNPFDELGFIVTLASAPPLTTTKPAPAPEQGAAVIGENQVRIFQEQQARSMHDPAPESLMVNELGCENRFETLDRDQPALDETAVESLPFCNSTARDLLPEPALPVEQCANVSGEDEVRIQEHPSIMQDPAPESSTANVSEGENLMESLSNEIHEDEDLMMINGPTSQVINYGYLNNNPIRSHQPHHLPTQNFWNSSIAGATASLSGEFETPMPSSTNPYDELGFIVTLASAPPLTTTKPAPAPEQGAAVIAEKQVRIFQEQQARSMHDPAPKSLMANEIGCENRFETLDRDQQALDETAVESLPFCNSAARDLLPEPALPVEQCADVSGEDEVRILEHPSIMQDPAPESSTANVSEGENLMESLSNEIHEDEDLMMINGQTSQVINYGYLNNNPIRSHQPHHLPTQNFRNSSIAGAATASLLGEFEMPMPSSTNPYDELGFIVKLASAPPLTTTKPAPAPEQGAAVIGENQVRIFQEQQAPSIHDPAPESLMANELRCENRFETLDRDQPTLDETAVESLPFCNSAAYDLLPEPALPVEQSANVAGEDEVRILEHPSIMQDPAPESSTANVSEGENLMESLEYPEHLCYCWQDLFPEEVLKNQQSPLQEF